MARKHHMDEVARSLNKKNDVKVDTRASIVYLMEDSTKKSNDLGNGSWGKIDFLVNHKGYVKQFVETFPANIR